MSTSEYLVITNRDVRGNRFRPSDWTDRLASSAAEFVDGRIQYDSRVMPCRRCDNKVCLRVDLAIRQDKPQVMEFIQDFMQTNQLKNHIESCPGLYVAVENPEPAVVIAPEPQLNSVSAAA